MGTVESEIGKFTIAARSSPSSGLRLQKYHPAAHAASLELFLNPLYVVSKLYDIVRTVR